MIGNGMIMTDHGIMTNKGIIINFIIQEQDLLLTPETMATGSGREDQIAQKRIAPRPKATSQSNRYVRGGITEDRGNQTRKKRKTALKKRKIEIAKKTVGKKT